MVTRSRVFNRLNGDRREYFQTVVYPKSPFGGSETRRYQGVLRTRMAVFSTSVLPFFSHLKLSGAPRGLPFDAGKNSAPRARRPQPRRNAGERPERKRHAMPPAEAWYGCGQRALSASDSFPSSKGNPLATHAKVSIG